MITYTFIRMDMIPAGTNKFKLNVYAVRRDNQGNQHKVVFTDLYDIIDLWVFHALLDNEDWLQWPMELIDGKTV